MKKQNLEQTGRSLTRQELKQILGGKSEGCNNVFTTDTMTPNASSTYMTYQQAGNACAKDPGCVGITVECV